VDFSEARDPCGITFQNQGSNCEIIDCWLILDKPTGFFAKLVRILNFRIIFVRKKSWTTSGLSGSSPELGLAAAPDHGGLPRGWPREGGEAVRWRGHGREKEGTSQWCGSVPSGQEVLLLGRGRGSGAVKVGNGQRQCLGLKASVTKVFKNGGGTV
jgi:hypothetical protein